jgi:hypothetical protein
MDQPSSRYERWTSIADEPDHPLAALDGRQLATAELRVVLGRKSRYGARYFALLLAGASGALTDEATLTGLHNQGPLPSDNWIEVAETNAVVRIPGQGDIAMSEADFVRLFALFFDLLPPGGHVMVEYDSPQRAETARALAQNVPPIASPLGEFLFRAGFGPLFKDWQIAEGGAEGPRKLQAYETLSTEQRERWSADVVRAACARAEALLPELEGQ